MLRMFFSGIWQIIYCHLVVCCTFLELLKFSWLMEIFCHNPLNVEMDKIPLERLRVDVA